MMTGNGIAYAGTPGHPAHGTGWLGCGRAACFPLRPLSALLRVAECMPENQLGWQLKIAALRNKTNPFREMNNSATSVAQMFSLLVLRRRHGASAVLATIRRHHLIVVHEEAQHPLPPPYPRPCGAGPMLPPGMNSAG